MRELLFVVAFFWWLFGMQQPMEKQALAIAQRVPVNELDTGLPGSPFFTWFEQVVGWKSGVIWQLGECGQTVSDPTLAFSETGRVTNVRAISGHPLLRDVAVEAARKWVFNTTTLDGVPVTTRIVLNFDFTVPD
jgi:Gram-negative bacterial TonB protein C-terminal